MRWLALCAVLVLLAGCAAPGDGNDTVVADEDQTGGAVTQTIELGRLDVNTPGPGPHTFTVDVPPGGSVNVRWTLTVTGPNVTSSVTGNGCGTNGNIGIVVGATSTKSGSCDDLPTGPAEFTVNLTDPAAAFTAVISGTVTL